MILVCLDTVHKYDNGLLFIVVKNLIAIIHVFKEQNNVDFRSTTVKNLKHLPNSNILREVLAVYVPVSQCRQRGPESKGVVFTTTLIA